MSSKMNVEEMARALTNFVNVLGNGKAEKEFCDALSREHRTLQQNVFGLFTSAIRKWAETEHFDARNEFTIQTCKKIVDNVEEVKYRPPLI